MNRSVAAAADHGAERTMVFVLYDKVTLQDVAAPLEIFARANDFGARYRVLLVSPTGQPVGTTAFTRLSADIPVTDAPASIDTLLVPGGVPADFTFASGTHDIPEELTPDTVPEALAMVQELAPRASRIASVCTGAFVLAALGLLDGRRATTHWAHCARLAREYPRIDVDLDALFVQDGPFVTGRRHQRGHRHGPGHRRERLRHRRRPQGRPVDGRIPATPGRPGAVQRLVRGGRPHHAWSAPGPGLGGPRSGRRPLDCRDGLPRRGERTPPGADVPRRGGCDSRLATWSRPGWRRPSFSW